MGPGHRARWHFRHSQKRIEKKVRPPEGDRNPVSCSLHIISSICHLHMINDSHNQQGRNVVHSYRRDKKAIGVKDKVNEKHTPRWAIKNEREEEATNLGPPIDDWEIIDIETSNITSGDTNKETAFARMAAT